MQQFCNYCKQDKEFSEAGNVYQIPSEPELWQLWKCNRCSTPLIWWRESEDDEQGKVFPDRELKPIIDYNHVPSQLRLAYVETVKAFNAGSYLLCSAGLRAIVEGICTDKGVTSGPFPAEQILVDSSKQGRTASSLACRIEGLVTNSLLSGGAAKALHNHRYFGDSAVHELENPTFSQLSDAIILCEHALNDVYENRARGEALTASRGGA